ncbi:MAG: RecX family transcriptional regulator [Candidatus Cloacimonetes bacterium]|nr:RecX family transcriptional regulator [Candidatus Cloacimonadota bacterium]MCB5269121.1 RecX family transcriptional regulator [Candidatus Cloacimonadota bacterium]MCK9333749.1 RecX family transcriptional regulator [Candidatus Cloacimonadota bacterium]MDD2683443.1 RecX family transcriptional regulator [Candidatus Cloacimonadota bacterium]MDD3578445.1 RecX family transcriptional regulator [Candidatus Cloacimonadota bacterium]
MKLRYWTKNDKSRAAYVSLDNEIWGVLDIRTLRSMYPFANELELDSDQLNELLKLLENRIWWLLSEYQAKSEHSEYQCREYLKRKEFHPSLIDRAITIAKDKKYIDDTRFSEILIRSLIDRAKSKRFIVQKLYSHKIPQHIYAPLLDAAIDVDESQEMLLQMVDKLRIQYRELPQFKQKEKVFASLYRKGFDLDDIASAWERSLTH